MPDIFTSFVESCLSDYNEQNEGFDYILMTVLITNNRLVLLQPLNKFRDYETTERQEYADLLAKQLVSIACWYNYQFSHNSFSFQQSYFKILHNLALNKPFLYSSHDMVQLCTNLIDEHSLENLEAYLAMILVQAINQDINPLSLMESVLF